MLHTIKVAGGEMWKTTNFWPPEITSGTLLFPIMSRYNKRVESINHLDDNLRSPIAPMPCDFSRHNGLFITTHDLCNENVY